MQWVQHFLMPPFLCHNTLWAEVNPSFPKLFILKQRFPLFFLFSHPCHWKVKILRINLVLIWITERGWAITQHNTLQTTRATEVKYSPEVASRTRWAWETAHPTPSSNLRASGVPQCPLGHKLCSIQSGFHRKAVCSPLRPRHFYGKRSSSYTSLRSWRQRKPDGML